MTNDLLNLWITRIGSYAGHATLAPPTEPDRLAILIDAADMNLVVLARKPEDGRQAVVRSLRHLALKQSERDDVTGWLVVDVPVPNRPCSVSLVHRMIRRLYFTAVLQGLGEIDSMREAVQSLRMSYFQTRGDVTRKDEERVAQKLGTGLDVSFSLTSPLKGKLTAEEEVKVVEGVSAQMKRLDLMEAEDQLLYDLQLIAQLHAYVNRYGEVCDPLLPRWEQVRAFFKSAYAKFKQKRSFTLRPVFVFEAWSLPAVATLLSFLSDASAIAAAPGAQIIVIGGPALARAWAADEAAGHPLFSYKFQANQVDGDVAAAFDAAGAAALEGLLAVDDDGAARYEPEVEAVLQAMCAAPQQEEEADA